MPPYGLRRSWFGLVPILVLCSSISLKASAQDESGTLAIGYCARMVDKINYFVEYTDTKCFPAQGKTGLIFIFVSSKPVFSVEAAKKGWLIMVAAVFGDLFNSNATKTDSIVVTDADHITNYKAFSIPSPVARDLQQKIKADKITLDEMYHGLLSAMTPYNVPPRPGAKGE